MTLRIRAGDFRHLVTINKLTSSSTDLTSRGQQSSPRYGQLCKWKCSIEPLTGQELIQARQLHARCSHKLTGRYVPNVTPQCQAVFRGSRTFHFNEVRNLEERGRVLEIIATEELVSG